MDEINTKIEDIGEIDGAEINLNPSYYIHQAILKAQNCLIKDDFKEGILQYRLLVEHIESVAKAAGMIDETYIAEIKNFKQNLEDENDTELTKSAKMAHFKIEKLLGAVLQNTPKSAVLELKTKN